jgi:hypothetical protein
LGKNIIWLLVILVLLLILMRSCILVNRLVLMLRSIGDLVFSVRIGVIWLSIGATLFVVFC